MLNPPLSPILTGGLSVSLQCEQWGVYQARARANRRAMWAWHQRFARTACVARRIILSRF